MDNKSETASERIQSKFDDLTRAERQLANHLQENWPVSGLASITKVASNAGVSTPTVARMVQKLGFKGFPDFQNSLREELEAKISNPIEKHKRWSSDAPDTHILNRFADAILQNLQRTFSQINPDDFDSVCDALGNSDRSVFICGGRITQTLAKYLFLHMQMIRSGVTLISASDSAWPHYILDVADQDILIILDIRRYQNDLLKLAKLAKAKGAKIVLITDQWRSPIAGISDITFGCKIEVPSAWDSSSSILVLLETIISQVQSATWETTSKRMQDLEELFDDTRLFRKFR
ncbi:MAG: MurR/RpiR family transcriptional regulator [Rhizobiales bacterium]|nr:MurR/RpiR family transcriptional regulator [Hyphomicrobiales bacterium]